MTPLGATLAHAELLANKVAYGSISMVLLAIYRPPSNSIARFLIEFYTLLKSFGAVDQLCLTGDWNITLLQPTQSTVADYLGVLCSSGLESLVNFVTHEEVVRGKQIQSCLDHIALRAENCSFSSCFIAERLADLCIVACRISDSSLPTYQVDRVPVCPDIRFSFVNKKYV